MFPAQPAEPVLLLGEPPSPVPSPSTPPQPMQDTLPVPLEHPKQSEHLHYAPTYHHNVRQDFHQHISIGDGLERNVRPRFETEAEEFQNQLRQAQLHQRPRAPQPLDEFVQQQLLEPETPQPPPLPETTERTATEVDDETMQPEPPVPPIPTPATASAAAPPSLPPVPTSQGSSQPTPLISSSTSHTNDSAASRSLIASHLPKMWSHRWSYYSFVG